MAKKKKIDSMPDFEKIESSQAVINTNTNAFANRREQLRRVKDDQKELQQMKQDIAEIKNLLKGLSKK
tara:strand:+ start:2501 stop:2704 length:204 start_codon:yes stop_codon:yes gene_type:complete